MEETLRIYVHCYYIFIQGSDNYGTAYAISAIKIQRKVK
jgi:hypothetical protein